MAIAFSMSSRDESKKTMSVLLNIEGRKKTVRLKDYEDETENLRAWCRALKTFEDELEAQNGK